MQFSTLAIVTFAATAMAAPTNTLVARSDLEISGDNAAELVKQYAPVYSLAPGAFAAQDANQSMGFLDFTGYVNFLVGLLQSGGKYIKDGGNALINLDINKVGSATVNFFEGLLKYFNAFLAAVKEGTKFDKAVYQFLINSGLSEFLSSVASFIVNFSKTFLQSPLLQGIIDVLKKVVNWLFGTKQEVQKTLGDQANTTGFDKALVAAQSVQSAAEKKVAGN
ncbi:hypothetical protein CJU90_5081 [Yarrowia sp. C11]|nr:hypothetical protein CJU90_5081 [Yarrowia sp. C11]KAG5364883.1 hypothetical protein CKK34_3709 [Yarrowia sp. E02]